MIIPDHKNKVLGSPFSCYSSETHHHLDYKENLSVFAYFIRRYTQMKFLTKIEENNKMRKG